jgi:hypothetical protein
MAIRQVRSPRRHRAWQKVVLRGDFGEEIQASTSLWCLRRARGGSPTARHIAPKHTGTLEQDENMRIATYQIAGLLLLISGCTYRHPCAPAISASEASAFSPAETDHWYHDPVEFIPITAQMFKGVYGSALPTIETILGGEVGISTIQHPNDIGVFKLRHETAEDDSPAKPLTRLGFAIADGQGVDISQDDCQQLSDALQRLDNYGDQFLGVTDVDFGFKFVMGTNVVDVLFDLATSAVTISIAQSEHAQRRFASPQMMAIACQAAFSRLYENQNMVRAIEIFRSNKGVVRTLHPRHAGCDGSRRATGSGSAHP